MTDETQTPAADDPLANVVQPPYTGLTPEEADEAEKALIENTEPQTGRDL